MKFVIFLINLIYFSLALSQNEIANIVISYQKDIEKYFQSFSNRCEGIIQFDRNINFETAAKLCTNYSSTEVIKIVSNCFLKKVDNENKIISLNDFGNACLEYEYGDIKKNYLDNKKLTRFAYHEAGHAFCILSLKTNLELFDARLESRNEINGITRSHLLELRDMNYEEKLNYIKACTAGCASEKIFFGEPIPNNCQTDFKIAYNIASTIFNDKQQYEKLVWNQYQETKLLLQQNKVKLDKIARELLIKRVLNKSDILNIL